MFESGRYTKNNNKKQKQTNKKLKNEGRWLKLESATCICLYMLFLYDALGPYVSEVVLQLSLLTVAQDTIIHNYSNRTQ